MIMKTLLQVLSEQEKNRIHESSLKVLANTGVRMDTAKGRHILKKAGLGPAHERGELHPPYGRWGH